MALSRYSCAGASREGSPRKRFTRNPARSAEEGGVEAAAVDVASEQNLRSGLACQVQVHDIVLFEVDFSGRSRAFEHHDPVLRGKRGVGSGHAFPETGPEGAEILCLHEARGAAEDNDL